jgi:hypothetical protein
MKTSHEKSILLTINRPMLVRRGFISRYPESLVRIEAPKPIALNRAKFGNYLWEKLDTGSCEITVPNPALSICDFKLGFDEKAIVNLSSLLAIEASCFPYSKNIFDPLSFIEGHHVFHIVRGPTIFYLHGGGDLIEETLSGEYSEKFQRGNIISYTTKLERNLNFNKSSLAHRIFSKDDFTEQYKGSGRLVRQLIPVPYKVISGNSAGNTIMDYVNAILSLKP